MTMQTDESRLIRRVLDGHAEDFGYFIGRYGDEVLALVMRLVPRREDAEEIVQDAFVSAFAHLDGFRGDSSFSTWVCSIACRRALSHVRRAKVKYVEIDESVPVADSDVDEALADERHTEQLRRAVGMLRPDEQALVAMFYYDDRPLRDIALIMGLEPGNVATRLHRIRKKLYLIMKKSNED